MKKKTKKKEVVKNQQVVIKIETPIPQVREQDLAPEKEGGKYMIPKTWMSERQVVRLVQRTPTQHIYTRPGKGGQTWQYVTGNYVEKVLNFTFGWNWDFKVTSHGKEGDQVWVLGELTVKDDRGHTITKSQFGRADVKFKKDSKIMLDFGNDLKAATTDSLKKCASLLGIASDIYGKTEFKEEGVAILPAKAEIIRPTKEKTDYLCQVCATPVPENEAQFTLARYKKVLCKDHQK